MQILLGIADSGAASSIPGSAWLPGPLNIAAHGLARIFSVWKCTYMIQQVYTSPTELKKLIAGHVLSYVTGDTVMIRVAGQVTMIAVRIITLAKQKVKLYVSFCELHHAVVGTYPLRIRVRLPRAGKSYLMNFLGPDQYIFVMRKKEALQLYVSRLVRCAVIFFNELFQVSMCYMDVIEAFSLSTAVGSEAVKHVFINSTKLLDEISQNKQYIHRELLEHKGLIERILVGIGSPCTADKLVSTVASTLGPLEKIYNVAGVTWDKLGGVVKKGVGSTIYGFSGYYPALCLPEGQNLIGPPQVAGAA